MAVAFATKGAVAEWQLLYDHFETLSVGAEVSYAKLDELLGRPFLDSRSPFTKANLRLLSEHKRGLVNVRNTGYRVVSAKEHETAAKSQHKSARRRLKRAQHWVRNADRSQLTVEEQRRLDNMDMQLGRQLQLTKALNDRVERVEAVVQLASTKTDNVEARMAEMEAKQEKLMADLAKLGFDEKVA